LASTSSTTYPLAPSTSLNNRKILNLATEFGLIRAKPLTCPLPAGTDLHVIECTPSEHASVKFQRLVGALFYIALTTRLDVLHAVVYLSRFVCAFNSTHFKVAQHVLQYLYSTMKQTICYMSNKHSNTIPIIHCDASYGTDPLMMKSYSGNIVVWAGGPIAWWL